MSGNEPEGVWVDLDAEMAAFDRLPAEFKQFVKTANKQWACIPMLKRALRCGRSAYGTRVRLLETYREADAG